MINTPISFTQDVYVTGKLFTGNPFDTVYTVLVVPPGEDSGSLYEVNRDMLERLRAGETPEENELEPINKETNV